MAKILVIDDDPDILSVLEMLLSMKGYEVEVIDKGEHSLPKIKSFKPDLILLDVLISGHDGRVICKEVKSKEDTRHIPVIMLSAHPGASASFEEYGADGFISKPFDVNSLLNKINEQLALAKN